MSKSFDKWLVGATDAITDVASLLGLDTLVSDILNIGTKRVNPSDVANLINQITSKAPSGATNALNKLDRIINSMQPYISSSAYRSAMDKLQTKLQSARDIASQQMANAEKYINAAENASYLISNETGAHRRDRSGSRSRELRDTAKQYAEQAKQAYDNVANLVENTIKEIQ